MHSLDTLSIPLKQPSSEEKKLAQYKVRLLVFTARDYLRLCSHCSANFLLKPKKTNLYILMSGPSSGSPVGLVNFALAQWTQY